MRGARFVLVLAGVAALGLLWPDASQPAGVVQAPSGPREEWRPEAPIAQAERIVLFGTGFTLGPAGDSATLHLPVNVPPRVVNLVVDVTLVQGASGPLEIAGLGGCGRTLGPLVVATGQVFGLECGPTQEGPGELLLRHPGGHLEGRVEVVAHICPFGARCPGPWMES